VVGRNKGDYYRPELKAIREDLDKMWADQSDEADERRSHSVEKNLAR
jgi:hypothetical protein